MLYKREDKRESFVRPHCIEMRNFRAFLRKREAHFCTTADGHKNSKIQANPQRFVIEELIHYDRRENFRHTATI